MDKISLLVVDFDELMVLRLILLTEGNSCSDVLVKKKFRKESRQCCVYLAAAEIIYWK